MLVVYGLIKMSPVLGTKKLSFDFRKGKKTKRAREKEKKGPKFEKTQVTLMHQIVTFVIYCYYYIYFWSGTERQSDIHCFEKCRDIITWTLKVAQK